MARTSDHDDELIPVFMPALAALLLNAEDQKGQPLTLEEVLELRDHAQCVMMTPDMALKMEETRGYCDLDPENCWFGWQSLRKELGREPWIDPGARVNLVPSGSPELQQSMLDARASLDRFRELVLWAGNAPDVCDVSTLIKTRVSDDQTSLMLWLNDVRVSGSGFEARVFELPAGLTDYHVGESLFVEESAVLDWMVNVEGRLYGGFSIRLHRESLSESEQDEFDRYIGVREYA